MSKKLLVWKRAMLVLAAGTTFGLGIGGGCLSATIQRILVAVAFD
jgi:hypothetical protein